MSGALSASKPRDAYLDVVMSCPAASRGVKVTAVGNRRELLANTLLREFRAVPGMPEIYRGWETDGAAFHYVSASPWQLASCLDGFFLGVDFLHGGRSTLSGSHSKPLRVRSGYLRKESIKYPMASV